MKKICIALFILISGFILLKPIEVGATTHNRAVQNIWLFEVRGVPDEVTINEVDYYQYHYGAFLNDAQVITDYDFAEFFVEDLQYNDMIIFNLPPNSKLRWSALGTNTIDSPNYLINYGSYYEVYGSSDHLIFTGATQQYLDGFAAYIPAEGYGYSYDIGYYDGYDDGERDGLAQGYDDGHLEGYNSGYDDGYDDGDIDGFARGQVEEFNGLAILTTGLFGFLSVLGNIQLLPGFKVAHVLGITIFFGLIYFIVGKRR